MSFRFIAICLFFIRISFAADAQTDTSIVRTNIGSSDYKICDTAEIVIAFPGGLKAWQKFLKKDMDWMVGTDNGAPEGKYTVSVRFMTDETGNLSDFIPLTKHGYGMEKEVIKFLKKSPKWHPETLLGMPVKVYRILTIEFSVVGE